MGAVSSCPIETTSAATRCRRSPVEPTCGDRNCDYAIFCASLRITEFPSKLGNQMVLVVVSDASLSASHATFPAAVGDGETCQSDAGIAARAADVPSASAAASVTNSDV